jgi:hypothetical protein
VQVELVCASVRDFAGGFGDLFGGQGDAGMCVFQPTGACRGGHDAGHGVGFLSARPVRRGKNLSGCLYAPKGAGTSTMSAKSAYNFARVDRVG